MDENGAMANRNGQARVLARNGRRGMQSMTPYSKEWIIVLICVNMA